MILEDMHSLRGDSLMKRDSSLNQIIDTMHSNNNASSQQISPISGRRQQQKKSSQNLPQNKIVKRAGKK